MRKKANKNRRGFIWLLLFLGILMVLSGCSLAVEDAGEEKDIPQDSLIGALVTREGLYVFDTEYKDRIYATVDKHGSTEPSDWEICFENVEGICFFEAKWRDEHGTFSMVTSGDEICDVNSHLHVSDEGESVKLEGTLYAVADKNTDIMQFYLNPVYQTESGEFYVTQGNSWSLSGELGGSGTMTLDEETSLTENGETQVYQSAVALTIEILQSSPIEIRMHFMDENLGIIHTEKYAVGEVPIQLEAPKDATCVIIETVWEDNTVTRELFEPEETDTLYVQTFHQTENGTLGKMSTEVIWR